MHQHRVLRRQNGFDLFVVEFIEYFSRLIHKNIITYRPAFCKLFGNGFEVAIFVAGSFFALLKKLFSRRTRLNAFEVSRSFPKKTTLWKKPAVAAFFAFLWAALSNSRGNASERFMAVLFRAPARNGDIFSLTPFWKWNRIRIRDGSVRARGRYLSLKESV